VSVVTFINGVSIKLFDGFRRSERSAVM